MPRLFAWSDLHVDYPENFKLVTGLSDHDFREDTILVAGDISSRLEKLLECLRHLKQKFQEVAFVPGNHDLWITSRNNTNSLEKLETLHAACRLEGIQVGAFNTKNADSKVNIIPLLTWYMKPEEGDGSLFLPKPGEDPTLQIWSDNYRIKWPAFPHKSTAAEHVLSLNQDTPSIDAHHSIITFSHFLPRVELVFQDWSKFQSTGQGSGNDAHPEFNFTRVAGCRQIDEALRKRGSHIHIYGHQHRNRNRVIDGVRYISHCLGYPKEWNGFDTDPPRHLPLEILPEWA